MNDTKIIKILKSLTPEELKEFDKFVESPYFNSSKVAAKLFKILRKYYPEFPAKDIEPEKIHKKLYPSQKYHYGTIRNVISELGQLAENFLSVEYYRENEIKMEEAKIHQYHKRKLNALYEKAIDKLLNENKEINSISKPIYASLINLYELRIWDAEYKLKLNKNTEDISRQSEYIALTFLDRAFQAKQNATINKHNYNASYPDISAAILENTNFEKVLEYAKENSKEIYPVLSLAYYAHKVSMCENLEENLIKFEKIYEEFKMGLDKGFHYNILQRVNNAFLTKLNQVKTTQERILCHNKLFSSFKFIDEEDLFPKEEIFSTGFFKNITQTAAYTGNSDWALMFIEKYKHLLRDDIRDDIVNYSSAVLYTRTKNFERAMYHYSQIKKPDYMTLWQMKQGLAVCHYELGNFETVLSICDSTINELSRKYKDYSGHDSKVEFFLRLRKLTKLRLDYSKKNLEEFEIFLKASREKYGETAMCDEKIKEMKKLFGK